MQIAAIAAVGSLAVITLFQAALALGAPWGEAAWGGRHPGVLSTRLRIASGVVAVLVYPLVIVYVLAASGLILVTLPGSDGPAMWILAVLFAIGAVMNLVSPSRVERIWGPVSGIISLGCAVFALGT